MLCPYFLIMSRAGSPLFLTSFSYRLVSVATRPLRYASLRDVSSFLFRALVLPPASQVLLCHRHCFLASTSGRSVFRFGFFLLA